MFLSSGLIRGCLGQLWASKQRKTRRFYGFTDLRGNRAEGGGADAHPRIKLPPDSAVSRDSRHTTDPGVVPSPRWTGKHRFFNAALYSF